MTLSLYEKIDNFLFKNDDQEEKLAIDSEIEVTGFEFENTFLNTDGIVNDAYNYQEDSLEASTPISVLGLSTRPYKALMSSNILTIEQLTKLSESDLYLIKNLGTGSIREIKRAIRDWNIKSENNQMEKRYTIDTRIEDLNLSLRSKHALKEAGIFTIGELSGHDAFSLSTIRGIGNGSIKEIYSFLSSAKIVDKGNVELSKNDCIDMFFKKDNVIVKNGKIELSDKKHYVFDSELRLMNLNRSLVNFLEKNQIVLLSDVLMYDNLQRLPSFGKTKYESLVSACKEYINANLIDVNNARDSLINRVDTILLRTIENNRFDGVSRQPLIDELSLTYSLDIVIERIEKLVNDMTVSVNDNGRLFYRYESFPQFLNKIEDGRAKDIMYSRIDGATLEEIAEKHGVSRERIRQQQLGFINKYVCSKGKTIRYFREDRYQYLYENYYFSCEEFTSIFGEKERTYNYLNIRYNRGSKKYNTALKDECITPKLRACIQKYIDKDYVFIEGEAVYGNFSSILEYYTENHCVSKKRIDEVYNEVCEFIKRFAPNVKIPESVRAFEGHVERKDYIVMSLYRNIRYYNYKEYDFDNLVSILNIENRKNMMVSTNYYYKKYQDLMEEYNILDCYELHNLLKRYYCDKDTEIKFARMPVMEIGTFTVEDYIKNILIENGRMTTGELKEYISSDTGFEPGYIQFWLNDAHQYYEYGRYVFNETESLTDEQTEYLISLMKGYICFKNEIIKEYNLRFPGNPLIHLPNPVVNKAGYTSNVEYIVKKPYRITTLVTELLKKTIY